MNKKKWGYIIVHHDINKEDEGYNIHMMYFDKNLSPEGWFECPSEPYGETKEELIKDIENMLKDVKQSPIFSLKLLQEMRKLDG